MHIFRDAVRSFSGTRMARAAHRDQLSRSLAPLHGLDALIAQEGADAPVSDEAPIFILSAGWRSGSTLLQRLICSGGETLIWGEPYDHCGIIQRLAQSVAPFSQTWPRTEYLAQPENLNSLSDSWIASLYPPVAVFKESLRSLILTQFASPAKDMGARVWGLKEVRFGLTEAAFLHWLFPNAKFLMIHRKVEDAFRSYRQVAPGMNWYGSWPDKPAFTPQAFAQHRMALMLEFPSIVERTGGQIIDYDHLVGGQIDFAALSAYCGVDIRPDVLENRVQGTSVVGTRKRHRVGMGEQVLFNLGAARARSDARRKGLRIGLS